jgi:hypothetical protein
MATNQDLAAGLNAEKEGWPIEREAIVVAPVVCGGVEHHTFDVLSFTALGRRRRYQTDRRDHEDIRDGSHSHDSTPALDTVTCPAAQGG